MTDTGAQSVPHDPAGAQKRAAAAEALSLVQDGMVLGLGSGSTAELFLDALADRVASGLRITGVPTSKRVGSLAAARGLRVVDLEDVSRIDLTVDGADEIHPQALDLIKGRGGALLREKLVAATAERFCVIGDGTKLVRRLGERFPVPVAVIPFGWRQTAERVRALGCEPVLRLAGTEPGAAPYVSDDGLYILDCRFGPMDDPAAVGSALKGTLGVVEHGLFLGMAERAIVAGERGVRIVTPEQIGV
jgi:ribose 5-phosphate isomerase A